jgi:homoserine dehydrogenase
MKTARLAYLGMGTVNRALQSLIEGRRAVLAQRYGIDCHTVATATRGGGWMVGDEKCSDIHEWLAKSRPNVVFEAIPLDPHTGQPALDYLKAVLEYGAHAISANKGPVVHGARELFAIANPKKLFYRFEASVMDGAPVFSLVRDCLPLARLTRISGVFTSTATVVIEAIERGAGVEEGIAEAQRLGIAEADPSYDVDGWDSAMKLCALGNVLFHGDLRPKDVQRSGIRDVSAEEIRRAHASGAPLRMIGETDGKSASVRLAPSPFGAVSGATLVTHFEAEVFPGGLTVTSHDPDPTTTAYGLFTDFVAISSKL